MSKRHDSKTLDIVFDLLQTEVRKGKQIWIHMDDDLDDDAPADDPSLPITERAILSWQRGDVVEATAVQLDTTIATIATWIEHYLATEQIPPVPELVPKYSRWQWVCLERDEHGGEKAGEWVDGEHRRNRDIEQTLGGRWKCRCEFFHSHVRVGTFATEQEALDAYRAYRLEDLQFKTLGDVVP